jgi:predicted signal transduction protein with EAL and GGDEF domain
LEVTEDAFIAKNQFQKQVLPMLRNVRARVSINDFGTGYPSLSVLADITADKIRAKSKDAAFAWRRHALRSPHERSDMRGSPAAGWPR